MRTSFAVGLLSLAFGAWIGSADAAIIAYDWAGTVDVVDPGFPTGVTVGEKIEITLTLDNSLANQSTSADQGLYSSNPGTSPLILSADIGGNTGLGNFQTMQVFNNHQGLDEVQIQSGDEMTNIGFIITFKTDQLDTLSSTAIPLSIDPTEFETATFQVTRAPAFEMFLPSFLGTIDAEVPASVVPEPASFAILGTALLGFGFIARLRRLPR